MRNGDGLMQPSASPVGARVSLASVGDAGRLVKFNTAVRSEVGEGKQLPSLLFSSKQTN
jgi:hypothetical protein